MFSIKSKGSPQFINQLNKVKILNLIRERGEISRADIALHSGISAPTVTRIVDFLINEEKLVKEIGIGISTGGRRPKLVEFSGIDNYVIGIDLGKTHIDGVLANLNAQTIFELQYDTKLEEGFISIMNRTNDMICELKNHPRVKGKNIQGIGMAVAGLINRSRNIVEISPDFHWENVNIKNRIEERVKLPVIFDNVSRVMALGELWYGVGKDFKNFLVVNVGYGIGAGIIHNGKPIYGPYGMAGEFGHMVMDSNSDLKCECGNYGCLEAIASGRAIALKARLAIKQKKNTTLKDLVKGNLNAVTAEVVASAAREGDKVALDIFNESIREIGIAIANVINLLSPEAVFIGGGVVQSSDLVFEPIKEIINNNTIKTRTRKIKILPVTFGMKAASKGAIALILNEVLNLRHIELNVSNDGTSSK